MAPVLDLLPCRGQSGMHFVAGSPVRWVPGALGLGAQVQVSEGSVSPGTCALLEAWPGGCGQELNPCLSLLRGCCWRPCFLLP